MRRFARAAYLVVSALVIAALAAELALVVRRAVRFRGVESHAARNAFEAARRVSDGSVEGVWEVPGLRYRPGARLAFDVAGERYEIVINSLGYRTREFAPRKPEGVARVLCIGGSTTVQGRTNALTYPAHLERLLGERLGAGRVEVLNLGINGTLSGHWLPRLEELFALEPDVIVQYEFVNDFFWDHVPKYAAEHPWTRRRNASLLLAWLVPVEPQLFDPYLPDTVRNLRAMEEAARERGVAHVVGTFAGPDAGSASRDFRDYLDWNAESWGHGLKLRSYAEYDAVRSRFNDLLRHVAPRRGLRLAPIDTELREASLFVDLCHLTQPGIERMARAFLPAVEAALAEPREPTPIR